jgi:hypothetical protein
MQRPKGHQVQATKTEVSKRVPTKIRGKLMPRRINATLLSSSAASLQRNEWIADSLKPAHRSSG